MLIREVFAAGEVKVYNLVGNFCRVKSITAVVANSIDVVFFKDGQPLPVDLTDVDAGDWARVPQGFDRVEITSSVAQTIGLQVSRGDVGSDRITGEVSVIDGSLRRVLSRHSFWGSLTCAALAGNYSHVFLWNPAGTLYNLVVNELQSSIAALGSILVSRVAVAPASLLALGTGVGNKYLNGAAPLAGRLGTEQSVAALGTSICGIGLAATVSGSFKMLDPIVVPPGAGLVVMSATVNTTSHASFQFFEELIQ